MCALPFFSVVTPADAPETEQVIRSAATTQGPLYVRLARAATPVVHDDGYQFRMGKAETMREGDDVSIIACGSLVAPALDAAESLAGQGVQARVINLHTLAPADEAAIISAAQETGAIVTAEEHYVHGGLGSVVAGVVSRNHPVPVEMVALHGYTSSGPANELMAKNGLTADGVENAASRVIKRK